MKPTGTDIEKVTVVAGFEAGRFYGVWLKAWDMLHNESEWFNPPFIFDPDAPADPGVPEVQGLVDPQTDRRISDSTPTMFDPPVFSVGSDLLFRPTEDKALADGEYTLRVRALDQACNASAWSMPVTVVIDTVPPAAPTGLAVVERTNDRRPEWVWDVSSDSSVVGYEVSPTAAVVSESSSTFYFFLDRPLAADDDH